MHSCIHSFENLGGSGLKSGGEFIFKSSLTGCKGGWNIINLFLEETNVGCGILYCLSLALKKLIKFVNLMRSLGLERGQGLGIVSMERFKMSVLFLQHVGQFGLKDKERA